MSLRGSLFKKSLIVIENAPKKDSHIFLHDWDVWAIADHNPHEGANVLLFSLKFSPIKYCSKNKSKWSLKNFII